MKLTDEIPTVPIYSFKRTINEESARRHFILDLLESSKKILYTEVQTLMYNGVDVITFLKIGKSGHFVW